MAQVQIGFNPVVVVLMFDGVDNLEEVMAQFSPAPERRAGVLVDHLVADSKESHMQ